MIFAPPLDALIASPLVLDDVVFAPHASDVRIETVVRCCKNLGDILHDDNRFWFARKIDARGELSDWKPMRSAAEARAYLVSKSRT